MGKQRQGRQRQRQHHPERGISSKERRRNHEQRDSIEKQQTDFEAALEHEQNRQRFGSLVPRNQHQKLLINNLEQFRLNFVNGPAGTGKTFVTTSWAAEQLFEGRIERIVLTRPMVGCDEEIGFLPGTEEEKFSAWTDPFMDVLEGKLGKTKVATYKKYGKIIARPLMNMRGATFRNAVVILDEAQNTSCGQMKMFLTRMGEGSRVVVDGDPDQSDLPRGVLNGLQDALNRFVDSNAIGFTQFTEADITRDPLVYDIVMAYRTPVTTPTPAPKIGMLGALR